MSDLATRGLSARSGHRRNDDEPNSISGPRTMFSSTVLSVIAGDIGLERLPLAPGVKIFEGATPHWYFISVEYFCNCTEWNSTFATQSYKKCRELYLQNAPKIVWRLLGELRPKLPLCLRYNAFGIRNEVNKRKKTKGGSKIRWIFLFCSSRTKKIFFIPLQIIRGGGKEKIGEEIGWKKENGRSPSQSLVKIAACGWRF